MKHSIRMLAFTVIALAILIGTAMLTSKLEFYFPSMQAKSFGLDKIFSEEKHEKVSLRVSFPKPEYFRKNTALFDFTEEQIKAMDKLYEQVYFFRDAWVKENETIIQTRIETRKEKVFEIMFIEDFPKELLQSTKEIDSNQSFETIKDDPIIGWRAMEITKEKPVVFSYKINKKLSKKELKTILAWATPIMIKKAKTSELKTTGLITGGNPESKNIAIIGIIMLIGIFLFLMRQKKE